MMDRVHVTILPDVSAFAARLGRETTRSASEWQRALDRLAATIADGATTEHIMARLESSGIPISFDALTLAATALTRGPMAPVTQFGRPEPSGPLSVTRAQVDRAIEAGRLARVAP